MTLQTSLQITGAAINGTGLTVALVQWIVRPQTSKSLFKKASIKKNDALDEAHKYRDIMTSEGLQSLLTAYKEVEKKSQRIKQTLKEALWCDVNLRALWDFQDQVEGLSEVVKRESNKAKEMQILEEFRNRAEYKHKPAAKAPEGSGSGLTNIQKAVVPRGQRSPEHLTNTEKAEDIQATLRHRRSANKIDDRETMVTSKATDSNAVARITPPVESPFKDPAPKTPPTTPPKPNAKKHRDSRPAPVGGVVQNPEHPLS